MSDQKMPSTTKQGVPVFPYYIDEEMTTSFLATIEGGLAVAERVSQSFGSSRATSVDGDAEVSASAPLLMRGRAFGRAGREVGTTSGEQWEWERQHTMISWFNLLRGELMTRGLIEDIDQNPDLPLNIGDIVEFSGRLQINPFVEFKNVWETYLEFRPQFEDELQVEVVPTVRRSSKSNHQPTRQDLSKPVNKDELRIAKFLEITNRGFEETGLMDLHMKTGHGHFSDAILTLRLESNPTKSLEFSKSSRCTVMGKVTGLVEEGDRVFLFRRSGLRMFDLGLFEDVFKPMRFLKDVNLDLGILAVEGPAIQVLPLAIFV